MAKLTVNFEGRDIEFNELPDGYYFLRKKDQMINGIRYKKSELQREINNRFGVGWKEDEIIVEKANLEFLNKIYRGRGDN